MISGAFVVFKMQHAKVDVREMNFWMGDILQLGNTNFASCDGDKEISFFFLAKFDRLKQLLAYHFHFRFLITEKNYCNFYRFISKNKFSEIFIFCN